VKRGTRFIGSDIFLICGDEGPAYCGECNGSMSIKGELGVGGGSRGGSDAGEFVLEDIEEDSNSPDSILGTGFRFGGLRDARRLTRSEASGERGGGARGGGLAGGNAVSLVATVGLTSRCQRSISCPSTPMCCSCLNPSGEPMLPFVILLLIGRLLEGVGGNDARRTFCLDEPVLRFSYPISRSSTRAEVQRRDSMMVVAS